MDNKTDVKAIMARFQSSGTSSEETPSTTPGRPKQLLQPTLSGQGLLIKKPLSESKSGSAPPTPKPLFPKNNPSFKSELVNPEPNKTKALAGKFANSQDNMSKPLKHQLPSKPSFAQTSEPKAPQNKPAFSATCSESKPVFLKPAVINTKPSWIKEDSTPSSSPAPAPAPKIPPVQLKPSNSFFKLQQQLEEKTEVNTEAVNKSPLPINSTIKPLSNFKTAQNLFNKEPEEQPDSSVKPSPINKLPLSASIPPPKPAPSKKPSLKKPSPQVNGDDPSAPKKNPLPNSLALGPAPAKPNRPQHVNLEVFQKGLETPADGPKKLIAQPPSSHTSNHSTPMTSPVPPVPSLPPRHPAAHNQMEELYDDVDGLSNNPPPLPPVHPSQMSKEKNEDDDEEGEMYEDLDEIWEAAEQKQEKKKEKDDREERKRLEAEKKEQKDREKKEQDARKKFKLVGPLEVLQKGKARMDYKGNKTDLNLKQGDALDIIRIQGNPEGKWLGRMQDGSIGYVKTTLVEIDFNSLKQQNSGQAYEPEVYDDIDVAPSDKSKIKGPAMVLPPLPGDAEEIYDDVDPSLDVSPSDPRQSPGKPRVFQWMLERSRRAPSTKVVPPPIQFSGDTDNKKGAIDEEIYDDVDSQNISPAQTTISNPKIKDVDPKKQRKLEKEEKEFRKKFKYEGEIQVLHQVTIIANMTNKKWSSKELPLKAGEQLDVIVKAVDNKFICRNEEGKFGYVSTSYVVTDDGDIYDDIGDDCIYDND